MRRWLAALAGAFVLGPAMASEPLVLGFAGDKPPVWRGISAEEAAGAQGLGMLYPAPNAGGLLLAILVHAAVVNGSRDADRRSRQAQADRVLEPHASTLASMTAERLLAAVQARLPEELRQRHAGLVVQMVPSFALAHDQRTLVLDNTLRVHAADAPTVVRFENIVRVVSAPRDEAEPVGYWSADDGAPLQHETVALLAHSIEIALTALPPPDAAAHRTQRYRFGAMQKMERGQPVAATCGRVVLRTLRDWLMSVPLAPTAGDPPCEDAYRLLPG